MGSPQFLFQIQSPPPGEASSAVDEAYINGVYAGINLLSSLTQTPAEGRNPVLAPKLPSLLSLEGSESARRVGSGKARRERSVTERARRLQKLLPWDKKMDTATVLEETYKYIKFLEAQVSVLRSMPVGSQGSAAAEVGGDLGMLNRQQLLQVVVNSPAAQAALYSKACCVYSAEQVDLVVKKREEDRMNPYDSNPNANPLFYAW